MTFGDSSYTGYYSQLQMPTAIVMGFYSLWLNSTWFFIFDFKNHT
jgi:hypothetical protein